MRKNFLAIINENECIGCTKCIQACPFDAIIGAENQLHIIIEKECVGCELCVEPCPVDCISMVEIEKPFYDPEKAKLRRIARRKRLQEDAFAPPPDDAKKTLADILKRKKLL